MIVNPKIDEREISEAVSPYIIAEISANHNGDIENAKKIISMAKACGANAVKMQTYKPETITLDSKKDDFWISDGLWAGHTLYELYEWAHTPWEWHKELFGYARDIGITIFSTPFDNTAVELLEELETPAYKIASFECVDLKLIERVAKTQKPLIISTGMANELEIEEAVKVAKDYGSGELILLHCVSGYPAPSNEYNLVTIKDMKERFNVHVGLSDHTLDNVTAISAIAMGAVMVEKHVTLDRTAGGPDDSFSLEADGLRDLCIETKIAWEAIGKVNYARTDAERGNLKFRRSLYFVNSLPAGAVISEADIASVRPGFGLAPKYFDNVVGARLLKSVEKHSPVTMDSLNIKLPD